MKNQNDTKFCPKCKFRKLLIDFGRSKNRKDGHQTYCKGCRKNWDKQHWKEIQKYKKKYVIDHKKEKKEYDKQYRIKNLQTIESRRRKWLQKLKNEVFEAYGGQKCSCCGEKEISFLAIDHINGGGTKQRKRWGMHGSKIYVWLRQNGYPPGFRVLCHNCNWGVYVNNGICPHNK